ncbi:hypothetical protein BOTNAR_0216g00150 [Botryotinia narcissicola]|uniref:Uncharacterized protein n=1 Tax=Botryotinia narcissicola TaxID=278944 RepID=A0A4Z1ICT1_9HELO|nr:hypothetical protein BOTNAR_0216g00150 [Botryotinia narcissicola]
MASLPGDMIIRFRTLTGTNSLLSQLTQNWQTTDSVRFLLPFSAAKERSSFCIDAIGRIYTN